MDRLTQVDKRIGLLNHVGGGNLGDDATLEAVAQNIRRRWPAVELVAFSMNPDDTATRHGITSHALRRKRWTIGYKSAEASAALKDTVKARIRKYRAGFYLLQVINSVVRLPSEILDELSFLVSSRRNITVLDLLIISGGGQLTEKDGPWGFPYTIFKWVLMAKSAGIKCIVLNVGAGPLTHWLSKFFITRALVASDCVSLRDDKSRTLVREIGFRGESRVSPDSVYGLEIARANGAPLERASRPIVGFAPMPYPDRRERPREQSIYDEFIRKLATFGSWLTSQSYHLTIFGTDIGVDPFAVADFERALVCDHGVASSQYSITVSAKSTHALLGTIAAMDYVVTCRFHGVVFAHLLNKPVLAIAHHPKVADLMNDLELSSYCVDIGHFDPELLADRFASIVINAEEIKSRMAASLARNRQLLRTQFDELFP
jgi:polysaccharide pyruvyl transferase WcaK-like protein